MSCQFFVNKVNVRSNSVGRLATRLNELDARTDFINSDPETQDCLDSMIGHAPLTERCVERIGDYHATYAEKAAVRQQLADELELQFEALADLLECAKKEAEGE